MHKGILQVYCDRSVQGSKEQCHIPESGKFFLVECGIRKIFLAPMWNPEYSSRNLDPTNDWNPESKLHWQIIQQ